MAEQFTSYSVDNDRKFRTAVDQLRKQFGDLTIPLTLISKDFYKSEQSIFQLKSSGQYPDLSKAYKKIKEKNGGAYPILQWKGKGGGGLKSSLTNPTDSNAINLIVNKSELLIGTRLEYGIFHQSDKPRRKIPLRKFLFIGPEASKFATDEQMGRPQRWMGILQAFFDQKMKQQGFEAGNK